MIIKGKEIRLTGLNVSTSNLSRCTKVDTHEFTLGKEKKMSVYVSPMIGHHAHVVHLDVCYVFLRSLDLYFCNYSCAEFYTEVLYKEQIWDGFTYESWRVVVSDSLGITISLKYRVSLHNSVLKGTLQQQSTLSLLNFLKCKKRLVDGTL